ncbi:M20 family metallopeptidase [Pseudonocardia kujensis]|uniref:M20 metallopeptidase family protein n=1 Tax=Pseudonocardia kujensis TaxID=1128675 RepID=UPI001E5C0C7F|nr:M20 family metallopeptidase [Pseudonocardia kujensis]MCE0768079.1 M20 family metallopeptidase [Pseudonocardia kujensis]
MKALHTHLPAARELRRTIHSDPHVGGDERATAKLVKDVLDLPTDDVAEGAVLRIGDSGPVIAVRAELDALPITEESGAEWASRRPGVAHLCGHDVHIAALVAVTQTLQDVSAPASLVAVFQPREEVIPSGAPDVCAAPAFTRHGIDAVVGVHVQPQLRAGAVSVGAGAINASVDDFEITVTGKPAHGGYPHLGRDPVVASAALIQSLQHLVSRRSNPLEPAVVTVGTIAGGSSVNQVAPSVSLHGTVRSLDERQREELLGWLDEAAQGVAAAHGCRATVSVRRGEPVLRNDPDLAARISTRLAAHGMAEGAVFRSCGADDFAYYAESFPSVMIFAGVDGNGGPGLHHPQFLPPDRTVDFVARIMLHSFFALADGGPSRRTHERSLQHEEEGFPYSRE